MKLAEILKSRKLTCGIPYVEVGGMLERISESKADGRERSIAFCGKKNELSFPGGLGTTYEVMIPECPSQQEEIGSFHTHPRGGPFSQKSLGDWENDLDYRRFVSCFGYPTKVTYIENGETKVEQQAIVCHTFGTGHPEYEEFRDKFLAIAREGGAYNRQLNKKLHEENRPSSDEEYDKYTTYRDAISDLVIEGRRKGIISDCTPDAAFGRFAIADVKAMLAEEKPRVIPSAKPMTVIDCDKRYTLSELKTKARALGISTSGDKKTLCSKLMAAGVV